MDILSYDPEYLDKIREIVMSEMEKGKSDTEIYYVLINYGYNIGAIDNVFISLRAEHLIEEQEAVKKFSQQMGYVFQSFLKKIEKEYSLRFTKTE